MLNDISRMAHGEVAMDPGYRGGDLVCIRWALPIVVVWGLSGCTTVETDRVEWTDPTSGEVRHCSRTKSTSTETDPEQIRALADLARQVIEGAAAGALPGPSARGVAPGALAEPAPQPLPDVCQQLL